MRQVRKIEHVDTPALIRERIAFLRGQICQCDARMRAEIAADAMLARKAMLLESIQGTGAATAAMQFAEPSELGIADCLICVWLGHWG